MEVKSLKIEGPLILASRVFCDERGFFTERYNKKSFGDVGCHAEFLQDNFSRSSFGVLRGLHFQNTPAQSKLVTCLRGKIFDVIVDIRPKSPTFGEHCSVILDSDSPVWLWVPVGFAHGFQAISKEGADVLYKVDQYWNKEGEGCLRWDDPDLKIGWPVPNPILSAKDSQGLKFKEMFQKTL